MARPLPERGKGGAPPRLPRSPSLDDITKECAARNLQESYDGLMETRKLLAECRAQKPDPRYSTQIGDLVTLPARGTAFVVSDIEGGVNRLRQVIDDNALMRRWAQDDPNDRAYLAVLGDSIDRSNTGSLLMEVLFELKRMYPRNIIVLPGNHELDKGVQRHPQHGGFYDEILTGRESYQNNKVLIDENSISWESRLLMRIEQSLRNKSGDQGAAGDKLAKMTLWKAFNDCFADLPLVVSGPEVFMSHAGFPLMVPLPEKVVDFGCYRRKLREQDDQAMTLYVQQGPDAEDRDTESDDVPELLEHLFIKDVTWSDFDPNLNSRTAFNHDPNVGSFFSPQALREFRERYDLGVWLRGHQANAPRHSSITQYSGVNCWTTDGMMTITSHDGGGLQAAYAVVPLGKPNLTVADVTVYPLKS